MFNIGGTTMDHARGGWSVTNDNILRNYRLHTIEAVIDKLWAMYFAEEPKSLIKFESILEGLIAFEKDLVRMENGRPGRKDRANQSDP